MASLTAFSASPCARLQCRRVAKCRVYCSLTKRPEDATAVTPSFVQAPAPRGALRLGLPSKGRMAEDTMSLLKDSALSVYKPNPRQYVASIPQIPGVEVWFMRASDVVRKVRSADLDLGIVGYDMVCELGADDPELVVVHDALNFGQCHLGLGVPTSGRYADVSNLDDLRAMGWSEEKPMRVVTGYHHIATKFFAEAGFPHVVMLSADGALEAAPAMGSADIILDLVSTGVTLRENNLKEIQGGRILNSEGVMVANRSALRERGGLLAVVRELLERFEAHLTAETYYSVIANMRGNSAEEVAARLLKAEGLQGLQGPTISNVYSANADGTAAQHGFYAATICVHKKKLYPSVKALQKLGGSGVLVQPMTYIFDEEPQRWRNLLKEIGIEASPSGSYDELSDSSSNGSS